LGYRTRPISFWILCFALALVPLQMIADPLLEGALGLGLRLPLIFKYPLLAIAVVIVFGSVFLPMILVPLSFLGMIIEVYLKNVRKIWLLPPVIMIGGYAALFFGEYFIIYSLRAQNDSNNMNVQIPFDINENDLVLYSDSSWFVLNTDIPITYHMAGDDELFMESRRLIERKDCNHIRNINKRSRDKVRIVNFKTYLGGVYRYYKNSNITDSNFCVLIYKEKSQRPLFEIKVETDERTHWWLNYNYMEIEVIAPDGERYIFSGGSARPVKLFPTWRVSCRKNRKTFIGSCEVFFHRSTSRSLSTGVRPHSSTMAHVARAMGLELVRQQDRRAQDVSSMLKQLTAIEREEVKVQFAALMDIIAHPQQPVADMDFSFLVNNGDFIGKNFDIIITGLEDVLPDVGPDEDEAFRRMALFVDMIHSAPTDTFEKYGDRIVALYDKVDIPNRYLWDRRLITKLGFIGPEALPVILGASPLSDKEKFLALCRVGASGRSISEPVLLEMWEDIMSRTGTGTRIQPITIAMKRIGIPVPTVPEDHVHKKRIVEAKERFSDITPQSPTEMCDMNWHRRRR